MKNQIKRLFSFDELGAALQESRALREARERADHEITWGEDGAELQDACISVMELCDAEMEIVRRHKESQTVEFSREKKRWTWREERTTPHVIVEHLSKARLYRLAGLAALLIEFFLSAYVLRASGYGWILTVFISGAMTAVLAVFVHGLIKLATERETPRESAEVIRKRVFLPFLCVTLPALAVFLFVRVLSGGGDQGTAAAAESDWFGVTAFLNGLLGMLSTVFDFALWLATLGLVPLGAAMLALADIFGWSMRARDIYDQLERRLSELKNIRAKYHTAMRRRATPRRESPQPPSPPEPPRPGGPAAPGPYLMLLLALSLPVGLTACEQPLRQKAPAPARSTKAVALTTPALPVVTTGATSAELHLKIDRSGSIEPAAAAAAASNLFRQLPQLIQALKAGRLGIAYFANKGWNAPETVDLALPLPAQLEAPRVAAGRLPEHIQVRIAQKNKEAQDQTRRQEEKRNREEIQQALTALGPDALNAAFKAHAPCTDLLGVLSRIGATEYSGRQVFVIVTDGFSTCKQQTPVTQPSGNVTVLVMLATAVPGESGGQGDTDQYFSRKAALLKVAPWLVIVPADEGNLIKHLNQQAAAEKLAIEPP